MDELPKVFDVVEARGQITGLFAEQVDNLTVTRPRLTAKLGLVHALPDPEMGAVTVLGVDDFESTGWIGKHHRCHVLGNHPLPHPAAFRGHSHTRQAKFPRPVVKRRRG